MSGPGLRGRPRKKALPISECEPIVQQEFTPDWFDSNFQKFIRDETTNVQIL